MPNGVQVDYKYDLFGNRVEKVVSTTTVTTTRYVYSGEDIIGILDGNNNVVSRVLHGPGIDEPMMIRSGANEAYLYADGLGSIIAVADANATLQETVEYGAYGQTVYKDAVSGSTATVSYTGNPYAYTGREPDAETGLYYYRARYYDVEAGRFIQSDPIGFKGGDTNLYAYVGNNPVNFYDPSGLVPGTGYKTLDDAGVAAIRWVNGISQRTQIEYGGLIYKDFDGLFYHTRSLQQYVLGHNSFVYPYGMRFAVPDGAVIAAVYHTHPGGPDALSELFSDADKNLSDRHAHPIYLGTPSWRILKYNPGEPLNKISVLVDPTRKSFCQTSNGK